MLKWLTQIFAGSTTVPETDSSQAAARATEVSTVTVARKPTTAERASASVDESAPEPAKTLRATDAEFLAGLVEPPPCTPEDFTKDDQLFLAGILKRWHTHKLEMPVLPKAAIR